MNSRVEAYDHTIDSQFWLKRFKKDFISFLLLKKITPNQILDIFKYVSYLNFFKGKNKHHIKKIVSQKEDVENQATISEAISNNKNILLKIDIEGDEFKILDEIDKNLDKPRQSFGSKKYKIQEVIKPNQIILVQVLKDERAQS